MEKENARKELLIGKTGQVFVIVRSVVVGNDWRLSIRGSRRIGASLATFVKKAAALVIECRYP